MSKLWFNKIPANRSQRWTLMEAFIGYWFKPLSLEDRVSERVLIAVENNLGVELPEALREWYRLTGNAYHIWSQQDHWLSPEDLYIEEDLLIFYRESQMSCWNFGIRVSDFPLPDPPVYWVDGNSKRLEENFSEFVLHLLLYNMKSNCSHFPLYHYCGQGYWMEQTKTVIEKYYVRTAFMSWDFFNAPIDFYEGQDIIIEVSHGRNCFFYIIAKTNNALIDFQDLGLLH